MANKNNFEAFEAFEADLQKRLADVAAAGWTGPSAQMLLLRGDTPAQFEAGLRAAKNMRFIANLNRETLTSMNVDVDLALERSIIHGHTVAEVRAVIIQRLAEHDEATHTNTAQPLAHGAQSGTGDIYADRTAQMKASHVKR